MSKSADAFRTISEVADWLGVQAHVLRFWESKFTQIKPVKRAGGRRYYRPADMLLLGGIRKLLHTDGLSIKDVQAILRDLGIGHVSQLSHGLDADGPPSEEAGSTTAAATAGNSAESDTAPPIAAATPPERAANLGDEAQTRAPSETVSPPFTPSTHTEWARLSEASTSKATTTNDASEPRSVAGKMPDVTPAPVGAEPVSSAAETEQMDMLLDTPAPAAPASPEPEPEPEPSITEPPKQPLHDSSAASEPAAMPAAVEGAPLESAPQDGGAEAPVPDGHSEPAEAPLDSTAMQPGAPAAQPIEAPAAETVLPILDVEPDSDTSPRPGSPVFDSPAADAVAPDSLAAEPDPVDHDSAAAAAAVDAPNLDPMAEADAAVAEQETAPVQDQPQAQGLDNAPSDVPLQGDLVLGAATEQLPPSPFADVLILLAQTKSLPAHVQDEAAVCLNELRAIASQR
ncbi:MerR family transcriptional regulator [Pseudophaeobacter profundi]|uniref:MerR family transcriptional regulator n=1 Tax=Pseudophaeobacter profundi TaxID=3034152 RepID=UPI002430AA2B|nr:MerR family transcriptional regulator [Pseudophaeobacter profundi]